VILETGIIDAIYRHRDVVIGVDLVGEYLVGVEVRIVGIVHVVTPE
jgi:hypothetical protein